MIYYANTHSFEANVWVEFVVYRGCQIYSHLFRSCCQTYTALEILYIEIITCCSRPLCRGSFVAVRRLSGWQRGDFMLSADEEWVRRLFLFVSIVYCVYNSSCSTIMLYYGVSPLPHHNFCPPNTSHSRV